MNILSKISKRIFLSVWPILGCWGISPKCAGEFGEMSAGCLQVQNFRKVRKSYLIFRGGPEVLKKCGNSARWSGLFSYFVIFVAIKRKFQIFEIFRISFNGGTEKALNSSVEKVLNSLGMYWKSAVKVLIFGLPVLVDTLCQGISFSKFCGNPSN